MKISPEFDIGGDPTDATLQAIASWQPDFSVPDPWGEFLMFCEKAWNMDYGTVREERDGDHLLACFVTGGWSSNEMIQRAMEKNTMFMTMCWHSSYRGGLVKYLKAGN